jgi:hypothetical protein
MLFISFGKVGSEVCEKSICFRTHNLPNEIEVYKFVVDLNKLSTI